jgi:hypothetical protein
MGSGGKRARVWVRVWVRVCVCVYIHTNCKIEQKENDELFREILETFLE